MKHILYIPSYNKQTELDLYISEKYPQFLIEKNPSLIFVSGGDGSLLNAIQDYAYYKVPFIGIAAGTVNFLMNEINLVNFFDLLNKEITILETSTLNVKVKRSRSNGIFKTIFKAQAANDIVLGQQVMDYHGFYISGLLDQPFNIYGLGLIISTAIGSTAFNLNNGGDIITEVEGFHYLFSSIISNKREAFSELIDLQSEIKIELISDKTDCSIFIDGRTKVFQIKKGDIVTFSRGEKIKLGFIDIDLFFNKRRF